MVYRKKKRVVIERGENQRQEEPGDLTTHASKFLTEGFGSLFEEPIRV